MDLDGAVMVAQALLFCALFIGGSVLIVGGFLASGIFAISIGVAFIGYSITGNG